MSSAEMHKFEEAMMDDPMLAEAVDGYRLAAAETNPADDLAFLSKKLEAATLPSAKVVRGSFPQWMSIAAGLVLLLSVSVVLYRIFGAEEQIPKETITTNTPVDHADSQPQTTVDSNTVAIHQPPVAETKPITIISPGLAEPEQLKKKKAEPAVVKTESRAEEDYKRKDNTSDVAINDAKAPPSPAAGKPAVAPAKESEEVALMDKKQMNEARLNKFTGQVVDENNQPLPFSNVREKNSGVGTYTDAKGYFTIVSSDSVVNVETRSVGYTSNAMQLRTNQQQRIVLKDEAVMANAPTRERLFKRSQKPNADSAEVYDTEPADGWNNYSTYVLNNNREMEANLKDKTKVYKEVELSFDVNPDGSLSNIKVEKSDCRRCNPEAIRLLKDGPKWKSKTGKTERTKYTIRF